MLSRRAILTGLPAILIVYWAARANSPTNHEREGDQVVGGFTLDLEVASAALDRLMVDLKKLGVQRIESESGARAGSPSTHLFVGPFSSAGSAAQYGNFLIARGVVTRFTIRDAVNPGDVPGRGISAPSSGLRFSYDARFINSSASSFVSRPAERAGASLHEAATERGPRNAAAPSAGNSVETGALAEPRRMSIGEFRSGIAALAPAFDRSLIPGPDPVKVALEEIAGVKAERNGGLWLRGDTAEGFSRLRWVAGRQNADLLTLAADGKVTLKAALLMRLSGADRTGAGASFVVTDYIKSNEGLYLLAQLIGAENRYCLYLGHKVPTAGDDIEIDGTINLDNNFDTRINTYRKDGMKLPKECPPEGFDSLVAINPTARWFNLRVKRLVPDGVIVFHELAEALAKVDDGFEYLPDGLRPGAHDIAVQREIKLQSQRPGSDTVITMGSNVVFKTTESFLRFRAEREATSSRR